MSGLVGFFDDTKSKSSGRAMLERMNDLLHHQSFFENDLLFEQDGIYGSRAHKDFIQPLPQPYTDRDVNVWFDGEIYNRGFFDAKFENGNDPEYWLQCFKSRRIFHI